MIYSMNISRIKNEDAGGPEASMEGRTKGRGRDRKIGSVCRGWRREGVEGDKLMNKNGPRINGF